MKNIEFLIFLILEVLLIINGTLQKETGMINVLKEMRENVLNMTQSYYELISNSNASLYLENSYNLNILNNLEEKSKNDLSNINNKQSIISHLEERLHNSNFDFQNRLFLNNIITKEKQIISYEILHYRAYSKHDTGIFASYLILIVYKNRLEIFDLYNNILAHKDFEYEINNIKAFHNQDEIFFYLLTDSQTKLRKFKFYMKKFDKRFNTSSDYYKDDEDNPREFQEVADYSTEEDRVTLRTFKDNSPGYDVYLNYNRNLKKNKWLLDEIFNYTINEKIENMITNISKGKKMLFTFLSNGTISILDDELKMKHIFNGIYDNAQDIESPQIFQNFMTFINKKQEIIFTSVNSPNKILLSCNLESWKIFNSTNFFNPKINNFIFDTFSHLIYLILDDGNFLILSPHITGMSSSNQKENICSLLKIKKLDYNFSGMKTSMEIFRKDLIIKANDKIIAIDINDFESIQDFSNIELSLNYISLEEFSGNSKNIILNENLPSNVVTCKYVNGYYILFRNSDFSFFVFQSVYPSSKIKGTEDFNFNFKIPIIFIALIIIFFYHYFKNKKSATEGELNKNREEIINQLKNYGAFDNKNEKRQSSYEKNSNSKKNPINFKFEEDNSPDVSITDEDCEPEMVEDYKRKISKMLKKNR